MLEDGIGLVRSFVDSFEGRSAGIPGKKDGFFSAVDGTAYVRDANPAAETSLRPVSRHTNVSLRRRARGSVAVVTGSCFAPMMRALFARTGYDAVDVVMVENRHFGGNTSVAGLLTGIDVLRTLDSRQGPCRYLLPDVCLNEGRFLDDVLLEQITARHDVEVVPTSGAHLRQILDLRLAEVRHGD